jgi:hypothetical protein
MYLSPLSSYARKPLVLEKEKIHARAVLDLEASMKGPAGILFLFGTSHSIRGSYNLDLTIAGKGNLQSVYMHGNEGGDIASQNLLRDFLHDEFKFSFRISKKSSYKFNYILNFN